MKKKKKIPTIITICLYLFVAVIICSCFFLRYFRSKFGPNLITCAETEVERLTTLVMNNCIRKYMEQEPNLENILTITRTENQEIERIRYNTTKVNKMTTSVTKMLEDDLGYMTKGEFEKIDLNLNNISESYYTKLNDGIIFTISAGTATGNSFLANLGPKIPLNLTIVENVSTKMNTKITEYGINNAMIEVFIHLKASTVIHMPFMSKKVTVENDIPITMEILQGNIPSYYLGKNLPTE